jgi:ABC-2 type transport system permease protein
MAVYEHHYKPYSGPLTPLWSRFLILPRYAYQAVFQSKFFIAFFALCFVCPLIMAILIYLHHNVNALALMELNVAELVPINAYFFRTFIVIQSSFAFLLTVLIGPPLVSRDLTNNALPLYLCRPFSRAEYVIGKMSVLLILLSAVTWVPGVLLFLFQAYLEGAGWLGANLWIGGAIMLSSWVWIVVLALLSTTLSAWIKWRIAASAALFAIFIIPNVMGMMISGLFRTPYGNLINLTIMINTITDSLFRQLNILDLPEWLVLPVWAAWGGVTAFCALCLLLLTRKVRAYEVVR